MSVNKYALILLLMVVLSFSSGYAQSKKRVLKPSSYDSKMNAHYDFDCLKRLNGKYPKEAQLLGNNVLTRHLKVLLKDRFIFLKNTWAVETPIEIKNNIFQAWGCQQHNCDQTNFLIVVDLNKNVVYCGIKQNGMIKIFSEDNSYNQELFDWSNRN